MFSLSIRRLLKFKNGKEKHIQLKSHTLPLPLDQYGPFTRRCLNEYYDDNIGDNAGQVATSVLNQTISSGKYRVMVSRSIAFKASKDDPNTVLNSPSGKIYPATIAKLLKNYDLPNGMPQKGSSKATVYQLKEDVRKKFFKSIFLDKYVGIPLIKIVQFIKSLWFAGVKTEES